MDLDGLEELVKAQHREVLGRFTLYENNFKEYRKFCDKRFDKIEEDVEEHGKVIAKSKGMITIIGTIWAAVTTVAALVAPYLWR